MPLLYTVLSDMHAFVTAFPASLIMWRHGMDAHTPARTYPYSLFEATNYLTTSVLFTVLSAKAAFVVAAKLGCTFSHQENSSQFQSHEER